MIAALRYEKELFRQNIFVISFGAWRSVNANAAGDSLGSRGGNRSCYIAQERAVELRGFVLRERRDETGFHFSRSRRFGHHRQRTEVAGDLCPRVWINRLHAAVLAATSTLFTERVLIPPFLPDANLFPWLCREEILERVS